MDRTLQDVLDDLKLFDDWSDRYAYLIELGSKLPSFPSDARKDQNLVSGCVSQVWIIGEKQGETIHYLADSDALIVRGLVALVLKMFNGKTPKEVVAFDAKTVFQEIGLGAHLSPGRSNGMHSMVARMKEIASAVL